MFIFFRICQKRNCNVVYWDVVDVWCKFTDNSNTPTLNKFKAEPVKNLKKGFEDNSNFVLHDNAHNKLEGQINKRRTAQVQSSQWKPIQIRRGGFIGHVFRHA